MRTWIRVGGFVLATLALPFTAMAQVSGSQDTKPTFTTQELQPFLAAVGNAERVKDPMQRCVGYPDPPGSHWSHDAVIAYCSYLLLLPVPNLADVKASIAAGHAEDIDAKIAKLDRLDVVRKNHLDPMWRFLAANFFAVSPDVRSTLEAWKSQRPQSALAFLASAINYAVAAGEARGSKIARDTSQQQFDAMNALLAKATVDLHKAVDIDPTVIDIYTVTLWMGKYGAPGRLEIQAAVDKGLTLDPANLSIYVNLLVLAQPRWGGSLPMQQSILRAALAYSAQNPTLLTLKADVMADAAKLDYCRCETSTKRAIYRLAFQDVSPRLTLWSAGHNAFRNRQFDLAAVYLSEYLRFDPDDPDASGERDKAIAAWKADSTVTAPSH